MCKEDRYSSVFWCNVRVIGSTGGGLLQASMQYLSTCQHAIPVRQSSTQHPAPSILEHEEDCLGRLHPTTHPRNLPAHFHKTKKQSDAHLFKIFCTRGIAAVVVWLATVHGLSPVAGALCFILFSVANRMLDTLNF